MSNDQWRIAIRAMSPTGGRMRPARGSALDVLDWIACVERQMEREGK